VPQSMSCGATYDSPYVEMYSAKYCEPYVEMYSATYRVSRLHI
jgi:hypothetical protein